VPKDRRRPLPRTAGKAAGSGLLPIPVSFPESTAGMLPVGRARRRMGSKSVLRHCSRDPVTAALLAAEVRGAWRALALVPRELALPVSA